jgi:hypothetical protein
LRDEVGVFGVPDFFEPAGGEFFGGHAWLAWWVHGDGGLVEMMRIPGVRLMACWGGAVEPVAASGRRLGFSDFDSA